MLYRNRAGVRLLIKALVRDMRHYEEFLLSRLTKIDGVRRVHSSFVLRQPINKTQLPIQGFNIGVLKI